MTNLFSDHHYDDENEYDYGEYGVDCSSTQLPTTSGKNPSDDGKRALGMRWSAQRLLEEARLDIRIPTISYIHAYL